MSSRPLILGLLCASALALTACGAVDTKVGGSEDGGGLDTSFGGSDDDDGGSAASDSGGGSSDLSRDEQILEFYQCLRDNGLDVDDPAQAGAISLEGIDRDSPSEMAVVEDCADSHMGGGLMGSGEGMADTDALVAFVDCMRDNGIDMPDPDSDGGLALPDDHDPNSSEFQDAAQECTPHLAGGGVRIGSPDGSGGQMRGNQ